MDGTTQVQITEKETRSGKKRMSLLLFGLKCGHRQRGVFLTLFAFVLKEQKKKRPHRERTTRRANSGRARQERRRNGSWKWFGVAPPSSSSLLRLYGCDIHHRTKWTWFFFFAWMGFLVPCSLFTRSFFYCESQSRFIWANFDLSNHLFLVLHHSDRHSNTTKATFFCFFYGRWMWKDENNKAMSMQ